jgi:hypothetical protein
VVLPRVGQKIGSTPALLATPKDFMQQKDHIDVDHVRTVFSYAQHKIHRVDQRRRVSVDREFLDLHTVHMPPGQLRHHRVWFVDKDRPDMVHAMNLVLGIRDTREGQSDAREKSPKKKDKRSITRVS